MTEPDAPGLTPITWLQVEVRRLERDQAEIEPLFPDLTFVPPGGQARDRVLHHGGWHGTLPIWPFDRPQPDGVTDLVNGAGCEVVLEYPAAYPMIEPTIHPLSPVPEIYERTQATWHVLPTGALCLLQSTGAWIPEASVTELLLKAAGWRLEYALMKIGAIERMSEAGIVSDASHDYLLAKDGTGLVPGDDA